MPYALVPLKGTIYYKTAPNGWDGMGLPRQLVEWRGNTLFILLPGNGDIKALYF
jgi:hypothetical protein